MNIMNNRPFLFSFRCLAVMLIALVCPIHLAIAEAGNAGHRHPDNDGEVDTLIKKQPQYDLAAGYKQLERTCSNRYPCLLNGLTDIAKTYGPRASFDTLQMLQENERVDKSTDNHHLAHTVGRVTAKHFGINGPAFLSCPTSYNYGCQHGFMEHALGHTTTPQEAASRICNTLDDTYSEKFKFYCYHGLGHGVLMAVEYHLKRALTICDTLEGDRGKTGCWQGVFMENVNAGMQGKAQPNIFSSEAPLLPCSKIAEKYRHECFINHAGWLMVVYRKDIKKATAACLEAPGIHIDPCLQSIGLMVTNPPWQIGNPAYSKNKRLEEVGWNICRQFPKGYIGQCVIGAIDNILNFDELDMKKAKSFCNLISRDYQESCYRQIGIALLNQVTDTAILVKKCNALGVFGLACQRGAGLTKD